MFHGKSQLNGRDLILYSPKEPSWHLVKIDDKKKEENYFQ